MKFFIPIIRKFTRNQSGAALVEFAIILPMLLIIFAVIIEGSRLMISYQSAISGVRDATRYLSRVVSADICTTGASISGYTTQLQSIVGQSATGNSVFPSYVTINSVTPSYNCVAGTYRISPAPIAQVTANVSINFPFAGLFSLVGLTQGTITTNVTDSSRIYGI
ncbi:MAG: TadE/TadG family type IV pilus assembly protein [Paracoccaceae bacterium]